MKKSIKPFFYLALSTLVGFNVSCKETGKTSDGQEFTYIKKGTQKPLEGEFVLYNLEVRTGKDSVFISTADQGMPGYLRYSDSIPKNNFMDEIFLGLKKGDSILVEAKASKVFEDNTPPFLTSDETIKIRIGAFEVLDEENIMAYFNDLQQKAMDAENAGAADRLILEDETIAKYVKDNNLDATKTESGLYYVIEKRGSGPEIEEGSQASVHYAGYLLDGKIFDTSIKEVAQQNNIYNEQRDQAGGYSPFDLQVGVGQVIPGWDEGLSLLRKGDKAKLIIPSPLAYGTRGAGADIPGNSILVFDVEIMDVAN
ncbi:FKBP-type peptidyl-prolyl cis-trans isomerase [Lunatimonas lonarensis]|uniref:Peptidyl-prolyl cis-trans isomerase n=1 Tax=Lunatimonas lonarensis TaxID=1232681 RepID=R7ZWY3_9BACT|nr:FKBP-type peptidyl-prolyl cis-trans isomerase [Lunatimonas lonarensis]EON78651.1 FKBP-type peptidyl-prolyl cis-trans isomerase [Lunatimonas lonarensis]